MQRGALRLRRPRRAGLSPDSASVRDRRSLQRSRRITYSIEWEGEGVAPCIVPIDTPAYGALAEAISEAFDGLPVLPTREGGSGPEAAIAQSLGAPLVFLGVGLPDDQIHAPNEKVNLSMLYRGAESAALLWSKFASLGRAGLAAGR